MAMATVSCPRVFPSLALRSSPPSPICKHPRITTTRRPGFALAAASAATTSDDALPARLQEIVRLFQAAGGQRARYQQLLYYGQKLPVLGPQHCVAENKVNGCVSQVWVVCTLGSDGRVRFEAESDSALTRGLAALLVEGLSEATPAEVMRVTPEFVHALGLQQSLTPSRSNGFLNMLKLMQQKTSMHIIAS